MSKVKKKIKPVDSPVYRYWSALYKSFYSINLYIDVGKRWKGLGFLYLLLVIALFSIPLALKVSYNLGESFEEQLMEPLKQIPILYIQNGELSFDQPMPFLIKNKKGQVVLIIDTTGTVNEFNSEYPYLNILFNKDRLSYKIPTPGLLYQENSDSNTGFPTVQKFDKRVNLIFDGKTIVNSRSIIALKYFSQLMVYPLIVAVLFAIFAVFLPVIALLGQVFSIIFFSFKISFPKAIRLLVVSSTPMLLFLITVLTLNIVFNIMGVILLGLLFIYFSYALYALRLESQKLVSA